MQDKHTEIFKIRTFDADYQRRILPSATLGFMEEVATTHAENLGIDYHPSHDAGFIWILRSVKYIFYRTPRLDDLLSVTTRPAGVIGLKALRRFEFKLGEELIGVGFNNWLMLDFERQKPVVSPFFLEKTKAIPLTEADQFRLDKIKIPQDMTHSYTKTMMINDLDWNNHVNNVKYADIIYNAIPKELMDKLSIKSFQLEYLKECKLGDQVEMFFQYIDNAITIVGKKADVAMFSSILEFS